MNAVKSEIREQEIHEKQQCTSNNFGNGYAGFL